ncbi:hypothetical protein M407DRAFT_105012 [Tulasnella calospora MUT 4182]|uniref:Uncharacterized protein n=1 Tax=Tulasnella calospora MUT 4182 TaxID=1051891 RepID=A0A0C3MFJ3_9AGAM|nr:hypothetical protein M407DRAFT_105012 [Tulasnella calospora MUT 4182]
MEVLLRPFRQSIGRTVLLLAMWKPPWFEVVDSVQLTPSLVFVIWNTLMQFFMLVYLLICQHSSIFP